jgi:hypothetical protein
MFPIERGEICNYMIRISSSRANDQVKLIFIMSVIDLIDLKIYIAVPEISKQISCPYIVE